MASIQVAGEALVDIIDGVARSGGSPLNAAVGLARLGHEVTLQTEIGNDAHGRCIMEHLEGSHVQLGEGSITDLPTSSARATLDAAGNAHYEFQLDWTMDSVVSTDTDILHTGSIAAYLEPGASRIFDVFSASPSTQLRSYDPNLRPSLLGKRRKSIARIEEYFSRCHVVKISDVDALWMYPGWDTGRVLEHILHCGARLAVITYGARGAEARTAYQEAFEPSLPVEVVDTVGAGDAFMAGLLHAIATGTLHGKLLAGERTEDRELESALHIASVYAGLSVTRAGANPPFLQELAENLLDTHG